MANVHRLKVVIRP